MTTGLRGRIYMKCKECGGANDFLDLKCESCSGTGQDNKEYCEYKYTNKDKIALKGCVDVWDDAFLVKRWKYCPYCGKEIRVQELER